MNKDEILKKIAYRNRIQGSRPELDIVGPWTIDPEKLAELLASLPLPDNKEV